ncbi:MAG: DUF368 domain-containing protein [Chloroflexi bacterium]|nr:DUF368 domain-containing protein [Chloroflexota bacterium]
MSNQPQTPRDYFRLFFSGLAMGSADIVPGVSGGTMAFILDIYEDLLNAIKSFNLDVIKHLLQFKIREAIDLTHWRFLLPLGAGIGTAVLALSGILSWLLDNEPVFLFSFFLGLVVASIVAVGARIEGWRPPVIGSLIGGTVVAYWIVGLVPAEVSHSPLNLFLSGVVAIMAMILPGISGSFILLILGQYEYALESVKELRILDLATLAAGCVVGITFFSRILSFLLARYHTVMIAALVGFMVGSLRKIWPWKEAAEKTVETHGESFGEVNVLPDFASSEFLFALALFIVGFVLVSFLEHQRTHNNPFMRLFSKSTEKPGVQSEAI